MTTIRRSADLCYGPGARSARRSRLRYYGPVLYQYRVAIGRRAATLASSQDTVSSPLRPRQSRRSRPGAELSLWFEEVLARLISCIHPAPEVSTSERTVVVVWGSLRLGAHMQICPRSQASIDHAGGLLLAGPDWPCRHGDYSTVGRVTPQRSALSAGEASPSTMHRLARPRAVPYQTYASPTGRTQAFTVDGRRCDCHEDPSRARHADQAQYERAAVRRRLLWVLPSWSMYVRRTLIVCTSGPRCQLGSRALSSVVHAARRLGRQGARGGLCVSVCSCSWILVRVGAGSSSSGCYYRVNPWVIRNNTGCY